MGNKARQYSLKTLKRLFMLSCNQCAAPDCDRSLEARDNNTIIAKICHIEAASNDGPRYNPNMTDDERRDFNNLILLCDECHSIIDNKDNESKYTVDLLKKWKSDHENKCRENKIFNNPTLLNQAIKAIASIEFEEDYINDSSKDPFKIDGKIKHNSIKKWEPIIKEFRIYYGKLNILYSELEDKGSFKKEKLLRLIRNLYLRIKGKYINGQTNEMEIIKNNADKIFDDVENELLKLIDTQQSSNDDIYIALPIILADAFMRCKILEEPK